MSGARACAQKDAPSALPAVEAGWREAGTRDEDDEIFLAATRYKPLLPVTTRDNSLRAGEEMEPRGDKELKPQSTMDAEIWQGNVDWGMQEFPVPRRGFWMGKRAA